MTNVETEPFREQGGLRPVTRDLAMQLPGTSGFERAGLLIRPYALEEVRGKTRVIGMDQSGQEVELPLEASGFPGLTYLGDRTLTSDGRSVKVPEISFMYYKPDRSGEGVETVPRTLAVTDMRYGVHSDHAGEAPTWYLCGQIVTPDAGGTFEATPENQRNFSMARMVGPFGDPSTAEHQQRWQTPDFGPIARR